MFHLNESFTDLTEIKVYLIDLGERFLCFGRARVLEPFERDIVNMIGNEL